MYLRKFVIVRRAQRLGRGSTLLSMIARAIAISVTAYLIVSSDLAGAEERNDIYVLSMRGTTIYVPKDWNFNVDPKPGGKEIDSLAASFGKWQDLKPNVGKLLSEWKANPPSGIPKNWTLSGISLLPGDQHISQKPRLGFGAVPSRVRGHELMLLPDKELWVSALNPTTNEGYFFGGRQSDVANDGSALNVDCTKHLGPNKYFGCTPGITFSAVAVDGIKLYGSWYSEQIIVGDLRKMFWRNQSLLNWLTTPPDMRQPVVPELKDQ